MREFAAPGGAPPELGHVLALNLAEELQARGILAPIVAADEPVPPDARMMVSGRFVRAQAGTLVAEADVVDLRGRHTVAERRFREHSLTLFGERRALRRDAADIGGRIARWLTVRRDDVDRRLRRPA